LRDNQLIIKLKQTVYESAIYDFSFRIAHIKTGWGRFLTSWGIKIRYTAFMEVKNLRVLNEEFQDGI